MIIILTYVSSSSCSNMSAIVLSNWIPLSRVAIVLWWARPRRRASLATECSTMRSSRVWGMVVGRIILFISLLETSSSSSLKGIQRMMFSMPASFITLVTL